MKMIYLVIFNKSTDIFRDCIKLWYSGAFSNHIRAKLGVVPIDNIVLMPKIPGF